MRKLLAFILSIAMLFAFDVTCVSSAESLDLPSCYDSANEAAFTELDDPALLQYIEDSLFSHLEVELTESSFAIDEVSAIYISKEYLEETEYNTKANIFFGYSLADINSAFGKTKYVFTCDTGKTVVQEFMEIPDDTYNRIITNVLIGTGVILVCVVVTVATAGAGTPAAIAATAATSTKVSMIFAVSAKTATSMALTGAAFGATTTAIVRAVETGGDMHEAFNSAVLAGSEGYKWGAISGAVTGGVTQAFKIRKISKNPVPSAQEAERQAFAKLGGHGQKSYISGEEVPWGTPGSVRPDVVSNNVAYEVKCYDLTSKPNLNGLRTTLTQEISNRLVNLPEGMKQAIILNVEGRGYTQASVQSVIEWVHSFIDPIYPSIPIEVMGSML